MKLDHILALTDENAVLQHAKFSVPARREGYTVDDNARALVFAAKAHRLWPLPKPRELQRKLLSFILLMQEDDGRFHNFMDFSHRITDEPSVGDHLGRAIWSAGKVMNSDLPEGMKATARLIFDRALPWARDSASPRTRAYACLGICERLSAEPNESNLKHNLKLIADSLTSQYRGFCSSDWKWFENILAYDNPRMSHALFCAFDALGVQDYLTVAEESLVFLSGVETIEGKFVPIGSRGWYPRGGHRALYDQQPIEAGAMVEAAALAHKVLGTKEYEQILRKALGWFLGMNTKSVMVYDESTGACCDGINEEGLNQNQGSESTLAFLLAAEAMVSLFKDIET